MFTITQVCVRENQRKPITNYINVQATELIRQELLDNMRIYYSFLSSFSIILSPESKLIPVFIIEIWFISGYPTLNSRFPLRSKEALQELIKYSKKKNIYIYLCRELLFRGRKNRKYVLFSGEGDVQVKEVWPIEWGSISPL